MKQSLRLGLEQPAVTLKALKALKSLKEDVLTPARSAVERHPEHIGLLALAARIELDCGNGAEALAKAQRLSELVPDRVDLVIPIMERLIKRGWLTEAQTLVEPFKRDIPEDPEIERLVGLLEAKAKKAKKRTAAARKAFEPSPDIGLWRRAFRFGKYMLNTIRRA